MRTGNTAAFLAVCAGKRKAPFPCVPVDTGLFFIFIFFNFFIFIFLFFIIIFFNAILVCLHSFYVCMYVCMYGFVGSSFLCEGFL